MNEPLRVLLIEDNEDDAFLVTRALTKGGYDVVSERVQTAAEMKAALNRSSWDVVLSDHSMPRFDSSGALATLQESGFDLPFLIVSGNIGEELAVGAMKSGAHDFLHKGKLGRLVPAVEREIREASIRREQRFAQRITTAVAEISTRFLETNSVERAAESLVDEAVSITNARAGFLATISDEVTILYQHNPEAIPLLDHLSGLATSGSREPQSIEQNSALLSVSFDVGFDVVGVIGLVNHPRGFEDEETRALEAFAQTAALFLRTAQSEEQRSKVEDQLRQSRKMEAIGQLAGGIAHDFNNLLQGILGYTEMALHECESDSALEEDLKEVWYAGERAAALTHQLLAFSRKQVLQPDDLDLNQVIDNLLRMVRRLIGEDIELRVVRGKNLGTVHADPSQIDQVLINLIVNARDAMPNGGRITLETRNDDQHVLMRVKDTGCGMDQETISSIFDPFFTTKEVGRGTGLGLATVYGIVEQHKGKITVTSSPGCGAQFDIQLPLVDRKPRALQRLPSTPTARGTETILVAEDDRTARKLTSRVLQHAGYTVFLARNGQEAVEIFAEHRDEIDLVMTDVVMPVLGGSELRDEILAIRSVPFLFTSAHGVDISNALREDAFLPKPYNSRGLVQKIRELLKTRT